MYHRDDLIKVQKEVREIPGVTAIIYVQTCATELRRRRKRGLVADRDIKMFINPDVCEGCGDCAEKSNCVAVKPLDHFDGTKKQIDQSVCNKDYSCSKGFCPSFIGVTSSKSSETARKMFPPLPLDINNLERPKEKIKDIKNIIMAGIGGTGVSTIAAKNIGKFAICSIVFFLVGYNLAYGIPEGGYIGSFSMWSDGNEMGTGYSGHSDWFFQTMFVCATASIVSGAVAERIKIWPFFIFAAFMAGLIYLCSLVFLTETIFTIKTFLKQLIQLMPGIINLVWLEKDRIQKILTIH